MKFKAVAIIVQRVEVDLRILYKLPHCISMFVLHCYGQGSHSIVHVILLVHLMNKTLLMRESLSERWLATE